MTHPHRSRSLACIALVLVASVGVATGVAPLDQNLAVDQTRSVSAVDSMVVERHRLGYDGNDVTEVTVTVNNTGMELTADLQITLVAKNGTRVTRATKSGIVFGSGTTTVTLALDGQYSPTAFSRVEIRLASSL